MLSMTDYDKMVSETAIYPPVDNDMMIYPMLGLCGETGELFEKVKKIFRDNEGVINDKVREDVMLEAGDILWYLTAILHQTKIGSIENFVKDRLRVDSFYSMSDFYSHISPVPIEYIPHYLFRLHRKVGLIYSMSKEDYKYICIQDIMRDLIIIANNCFGIRLEHVAQANYDKLMSRKQRNKLSGSGDHR